MSRTRRLGVNAWTGPNGFANVNDLIASVQSGVYLMPTVSFTANMQRHVACPTVRAEGGTVREVLDRVFADNDRARGYVLDDQGALRKHMVVFVNGQAIADRTHLSDAVSDSAEVYIMQALSGG